MFTNDKARSADDRTDIPSDLCHDAPANVDSTVEGGFCIDSPEKANWVVRRVIEHRAYQNRVKQWFEDELARSVREEEHLMFLFGGQLRAWVSSALAVKRGKAKSLNLPAGRLGYRHINSSLQVDDEAAVIEWARINCPNAVQIVERLSRSSLKDHFERTGEVPDQGVHIEGEHEKFYIT